MNNIAEVNNKCAPNITNDNLSCLSMSILEALAEKYITGYIKNSLSKSELLDALNKKMSTCNGEHKCWLQISGNNKHIDKYYLPNGPDKQFDWLSTLDINNVLRQYEMKFPEFYFVGAVPYDFEDLPDIYNLLDFDKIKLLNKHIVGLVINLDEHYKSGSHWVALYINLKKYEIYFFDSVGKKPKSRIFKFIYSVIQYMYLSKYKEKILIQDIKLYSSYNKQKISDPLKNKYFTQLKHIKAKYNNIQHQKENTECGVYSIHCIVSLLYNIDFENIIKNPISDERMNKYRTKIFYNSNYK